MTDDHRRPNDDPRRGSRTRLVLAVAAMAAILSLSVVMPTAAAVPSVSLVPVASGLSSPLLVTNAGDGSGRLFVVEKAGVIKIIKAGSTLPTPFLDIRDLVGASG